MADTGLDGEAPAVSVVLTTRDRPRLVSVALLCYRHQTYPQRELVVVDDGTTYPVDADAVAAVGGRLIRVEPGTPLGTKLNRGLSDARGPLCLKMDDDDWYAPRFLEAIVSALRANSTVVCTPVLAFLMPFLFFDVARWEVRRSIEHNIPGATLLFAREDWQQRPFRALPRDEDVWFLLDQMRQGVSMLPVRALETFLAVRHAGARQDRGHTWTHQADGGALETYLQDRPLYDGGPEALLPDWALAIYRDLRRELLDAPLDKHESPGGRWSAALTDEESLVGDRQLLARRSRAGSTVVDHKATVLILTPVKDAEDCVAGYCTLLREITYPHHLISIGFLESDSSDNTLAALERKLPGLQREFRRVGLWKTDFGYHVPPGIHRGAAPIQGERRTILARSRNHLLFHALDDEDWVLWLDVDVIDYPPDIIERLLATGKDIVHPHCVLDYGGSTFDENAWREHGRLHLQDLRDAGDLVPLDAVGGTMLLIKADLHRDGLVYPSFPYGRENPRIRWDRREIGEIETEGLGIMAQDMGHQCWGMPNLEIRHRRK
jgi:glycosyltransferase involved in cell wall biosynthesis